MQRTQQVRVSSLVIVPVTHICVQPSSTNMHCLPNHEATCHSSKFGPPERQTHMSGCCPCGPVIYLATKMLHIQNPHQHAMIQHMISSFRAPIFISILGYPPASSALAHGLAFSCRSCIRSTLYHCSRMGGGIQQRKPRQAPPKQGKSFVSSSLISFLLLISQSMHPSNQQKHSIPRDAGSPYHDPLRVAVLVLMMRLVLVLLPRVSAQRHVRHVTQPVVVDTVLGL